MSLFHTLVKFAYAYTTDKRGVMLTAFAIVIPIIVASTGVATDMSRAYLVKQRLSQALDAAALATAGSSGDADEQEARMENYFNANFETGRFATLRELNLTPQDTEVLANATARVDTLFMKIWGQDYIDVYAQATVQKELRGIEVSLVMDNTGSMATNDNISTLRTAATSFVNIMFERAPEPDVIKIGLVPYSTSVNVGPYGFGLETDGTTYGDGTGFVNNPLNRNYTTNQNSFDWLGCVQEEENTDVTDYAGPFDMYNYCMDEDNYYPICDYQYYNGQRYFTRYPNYICPQSHITPLSSNQSLLLDRIDEMQASGHTLGNVGMVWGWRVISPDFPFEEGASYTDEAWRKVVIMMTDGQNTMHPRYSAYRRTYDHNIDAGDLNDKLETTCESMKDEGIIIYTITFTSSINDTTKDYYRNCATDSTKYHDAPGQDDLVEAFEAISRELSNLYIRE